MGMKLDPDTLRKVLAMAEPTTTQPIKHAKGRRHVPGVMNKNEERYAAYLADQQHAGEILWWAFECVSLKLAPKCAYHPDFLVMHADRSLSVIDVKGFKAKPSGEPGYWATEDARIKLRVAAEKFPLFSFVVAFQGKDKAWYHETYGATK